MDKLNLRRPRLCPDRDVAWDTATWAVALQYETVSRKNLGPHSETRASDHYEFEMLLDHSPDQFIVKVFGDPKGEAIATQVMWVNGDPVNFVKPGARRQIGRADTINLQKIPDEHRLRDGLSALLGVDVVHLATREMRGRELTQSEHQPPAQR